MPDPGASEGNTKFLREDGTWQTPPGGTTYESKSASSGGTDVSLVTTGEKYIWNNKQDIISDLSTIRSGASAGATAYQKPQEGIPASDIASGVIPISLPASDVSSWAKANSKPSYNLDEVTDGTSRKIPTKVSELTNDSGYLTSHQSLSGYATESWVGQQGYLTSHQSLSGYATESWVSSKFNDVLGIDASGVSDLVSILSDNDTATGILNVIASKANANSIPTKVSDLTNDTGFITSYTNTVTSINGKTGEIAAADMAAVLTAAGYALTDTNTWPTALSQLSNDVGYITGITSSMVTTALGYTPPTTDTNTWRPITNTYTGSDESTSLSQYGANALYNALVNGYASSAGNADTVDGYHENSFLRYRGETQTAGDDTLWSQIGIKQYLGVLPEDIPNGTYPYGSVISLPGSATRFDIYCSHLSSSPNDGGNGLYYRSGWLDDKKAWTKFIDSNNIGSQSVNYATTAGSAPASDVYPWAKEASKPSYNYSEIGGGVIDTHGEGSRTIVLDSGNDLYAFYERGGRCAAYEVEMSATLTNEILTPTGTTIQPLPGDLFNGVVGYHHAESYTGDKFVVYDLLLPNGFWWGTTFYWSFGNVVWAPQKMRILIAHDTGDYIEKYSTDSPLQFGSCDVSNGESGFSRLRIVMSAYSRISMFGIRNYSYTGQNTTYMSRCIDDTLFRSITPAITNRYNLGGSNNYWNNLYVNSINGVSIGSNPSFTDTWRPLGTGATDACAGNDSRLSDSRPANGGNSSTVNGHTVNSDVPAGAVFTDTNTWRPLGTGANDACAGNDSRLSDSRPASDVYSWAKASSKPSYAYSEIGYSAYIAITSGALILDGSTYPLCCITLNGNISSVAFSSYPPAGHSCHIIFNNSGSSDYTVAIAHGTLKCPEGQDLALTVKAGGYAEIDVLHVSGVACFVRGV